MGYKIQLKVTHQKNIGLRQQSRNREIDACDLDASCLKSRCFALVDVGLRYREVVRKLPLRKTRIKLLSWSEGHKTGFLRYQGLEISRVRLGKIIVILADASPRDAASSSR